jgi:hypothetical protein
MGMEREQLGALEIQGSRGGRTGRECLIAVGLIIVENDCGCRKER